jgi:ribose-phosphate pyrophosphokinase|tara:strand:- start:344 stop:1213 length:870 start_codon:yes stop_codon:yes gene_type:complete
MITLNLVNLEKSDIRYKISKFPDGQQTVDIIDNNGSVLMPNTSVKIISRLNDFKDLELIICSNQALINLGIVDISLFTPYFMGARSDRKFQYGGVNYLKQIICPIINSQNFKSVTVVDPHSDVLEACLNNYSKINNFPLVDDALSYIIGEGEEDSIVLVSPDAGAYKKIFDVAKEFNINKIITATKVRDLQSGKILRTEIPTLDQHENLSYVIIDDICDGGRTFIELAKAIKGSRPTAKVYLVVTHGIFSAGFVELNKLFSGIYCTNSYRDVADDEYGIITNTKQLNLF